MSVYSILFAISFSSFFLSIYLISPFFPSSFFGRNNGSATVDLKNARRIPCTARSFDLGIQCRTSHYIDCKGVNLTATKEAQG